MQAAWLESRAAHCRVPAQSGNKEHLMTLSKSAKMIMMVCLALAFVGSSFAADAHKANFQISQSVQVNGTELAPGDYVAKWTGDGPDVQLSITRNGKEMATVPAKLVQLDRKSLQ